MTDKPVVTPAPEMGMEEKVTIMYHLTSAVKDDSLKSAILAIPSGDKIYELLVKAVHQEIEVIMGKSQKDAKDLSTNLQQMAGAMSNFAQFVTNFNNSPLIGVLSALNQKIGGTSAQAPQPQLQLEFAPPPGGVLPSGVQRSIQPVGDDPGPELRGTREERMRGRV